MGFTTIHCEGTGRWGLSLIWASSQPTLWCDRMSPNNATADIHPHPQVPVIWKTNWCFVWLFCKFSFNQFKREKAMGILLLGPCCVAHLQRTGSLFSLLSKGLSTHHCAPFIPSACPTWFFPVMAAYFLKPGLIWLPPPPPQCALSLHSLGRVAGQQHICIWISSCGWHPLLSHHCVSFVLGRHVPQNYSINKIQLLGWYFNTVINKY